MTEQRPLLASAACRSSTWRAGTSRSPTRTERSGSSSTARSTTTGNSGRTWKREDIDLPHRQTRKSSSISTRSMVPIASTICVACSPSPSGTTGAAGCMLARDRLGQKPLFYRHESNRLLFASELKAILQVPGVPRELNHAKRSTCTSPTSTCRIPTAFSKGMPNCRRPIEQRGRTVN